MGVAAAFFFAAGGIGQKALMHELLDSLQFAQIRVLVAALLLVTFHAARDRSAFRLEPGETRKLALYGAGLLLPTQLLYSTAISRLPLAIGTLLTFLAVANLAVYNRLRHGTVLGAGGTASVFMALLGAVCITGVLSGHVTGGMDGIGLAAGYANSVVFAAYLVVGGRLQRNRSARAVLMWASVFAAIGWSVLRPWWNFPWEAMGRRVPLLVDHGPLIPAWVLVLYVALVGTVLSFALALASVARVGAQRNSILGAAEPVFAGMVAFVLIGEHLNGWQIIGGTLIIGAIVVGETAAMRRHRHDEVDA